MEPKVLLGCVYGGARFHWPPIRFPTGEPCPSVSGFPPSVELLSNWHYFEARG
jgi:hypothetical protein